MPVTPDRAGQAPEGATGDRLRFPVARQLGTVGTVPLPYSPIRPSGAALERLRRRAESNALTYDGVGGTVTGEHPAGYHEHSSELTVEADWDAARDAIRQWAGHRSVGGVLAPVQPPLTEDATMAFGVRVFGIWATGTCRIVKVVDSRTEYGFSYGTLPHHPEEGEELFAVRDNGDGTVSFRVAAFSKPAGLVTRMIGPLGRFIQRSMTRRYLRGFADFASASAVAARR